MMNQEAVKANLRMMEKMGESAMEQVRANDPAMAEQLEKLNALLKNEEFDRALFACGSNAEAVALFAENGITITEEAVEILINQIKLVAEKLENCSGELSEEDLEQIAGGGWLEGICYGLGGAIAGAILGAAIGILTGNPIVAGIAIAALAGAGGALGGYGGATM